MDRARPQIQLPKAASAHLACSLGHKALQAMHGQVPVQIILGSFPQPGEATSRRWNKVGIDA